jgi:hypothetical protein
MTRPKNDLQTTRILKRQIEKLEDSKVNLIRENTKLLRERSNIIKENIELKKANTELRGQIKEEREKHRRTDKQLQLNQSMLDEARRAAQARCSFAKPPNKPPLTLKHAPTLVVYGD